MPICLPWNEEDPTVESIQKVNPNQDITITGWGKITNIRSKSFQNYQQYAVATRTLQTVKLPIQTNKKCKKTYPVLNEETSFCIGGVKGLCNMSYQIGFTQTNNIFEIRSNISYVLLFISFLKERTLVGVTLVDQRHIIKGMSLTPSHGFKSAL